MANLPQRQLVAAAVLMAGILLCGLVVASWQNGIPFDLTGSQSGFAVQSTSTGPVTISLENVAASSTVSEFSIALTSERELLGDTIPPPILLSEDAIRLQGVEPIRPTKIGYEGLIGDRAMYAIEAGPPTFVGPLTLTLDSVLLRTPDVSEVVDGPWSFSVPYEQIDVDPVGATVTLDDSLDLDGISVVAKEARFSSSEVLVSYALDLDESTSVSDGFPPRVLIELPDGSILDGTRLSLDTVDGRDALLGDHVARFAALPAGVASFSIRVGPFLSPTPGGTIVVSLPDSDERATPGSYEVESKVDSEAGDQTLVAEVLVVRQDRFALRLRTNPLSNAAITALPGVDVTVEDDLGNLYRVIDRSAGFGQTDDRSVFFREEIIWLDGTIDANAAQLVVTEPAFAELVDGPWEFSVEVASNG